MTGDSLQNWIEFLVGIYFSTGNTVKSVHSLWTMGGAGPQWTADRVSVVAH
jgi:hypothetical protein